MLVIISLCLSLILLFLTISAYWTSRRPLVPVLVFSAVVALGPCLIFIQSPVVILNAVLLLIGVAVAQFKKLRPAQFAMVSIAITVLAYAIVGAIAFNKLSQLRQQFPYVSVEERLPLNYVRPTGRLPDLIVSRLDHLELELDQNSRRVWMLFDRSRRLEQLHEQTVQSFAEHPGFGVTRMPGLSVFWLQRGLRRERPPRQPGKPLAFDWSTGDLEGSTPPLPADDFRQSWNTHTTGLLDFVNPGGFGYLKDRRHLAGFQEHRFSKTPEAEAPWRLQTLELVGLVVHEQPVVYVSDSLPSMEEVRKAKQRTPDAFELAGLQALGRGEDLYVRDGVAGRRMLGGIRSMKQCLNCHGGERGALLGAFSYTFSRDP
jgi:hypothetical protein